VARQGAQNVKVPGTPELDGVVETAGEELFPGGWVAHLGDDISVRRESVAYTAAAAQVPDLDGVVETTGGGVETVGSH